jgi:hypothetical protein
LFSKKLCITMAIQSFFEEHANQHARLQSGEGGGDEEAAERASRQERSQPGSARAL